MSLDEKTMALALTACEGIGPTTIKTLLAWCKQQELTSEECWSLVSGGHVSIPLTSLQLAAAKEFAATWTPQSYAEHIAEQGIRVVYRADPEYPTALKPLFDAPLLLFVKGCQTHLQVPMVAVVGTRRITSYGQYVTRSLTRELVAADLGIVSGFMYGVDVLAQQTANELDGKTIGVLGFGFEHMYPAQHQRLFTELLADGQTFVTEFAPHVSPNPGQFASRNRIIAGLSLGVVVTEAAAKSGSHITAACSLEYGRPVFAVPGPITNPFCEGTKALLNQGAKCVSSVDDILSELGKDRGSEATLRLLFSNVSPSPLHEAIMTSLATQPQSSDALAGELQVSVPSVLVALTHLEIGGQARCENGMWMIR